MNGEKPKKKVAIYIRISTDIEKQNLNTQLDPLVEYCNKNNYQYEIFQDIASGAKESRPNLDKLMRMIREQKFDALLVWKVDRLGRSLRHLLQILQELEKNKCDFISLTEGYDTSTPQGKLIFSIVGAFAEFERAIIRERVKAGIIRAIKEGKRVGRPVGSKDKKRRRVSGYFLRWQNTQQKTL
ncbi:MAG: resolvase [Candidatus Parcubacteria bacterium]|nr:MAG: resolvase [Candidatus Parcubacteria bacterium]GIW67837.1 MAG: resolvase [Candidatus Parcubacteria bacterium]